MRDWDGARSPRELMMKANVEREMRRRVESMSYNTNPKSPMQLEGIEPINELEEIQDLVFNE